ncbi:MAG: MTAP family purine nucleoside phosphorylase [Syntrophomonadaceae bacterium]|nr:MTAP family purine nucleoside phosphorylase [Syntrophomonadaceae bacterium]MDD3890182.1 MTAP family purine nucleoside phosphorylase [Syntrophomonadaceae bacterium]MDD4549823.1 MTAP family purine nucleoside phosphorylase [Syntrophomonadaceae bacterium]
MVNIPICDFAYIGGSSTLNLEIPESLALDFVEVKQSGLCFDTPYGRSPEFKHLIIHGDYREKRILTCRMHGWRHGANRADASKQVFWVLKNSGVKKILAEGGVGAINHLLNPRDLVIPHDYIDYSVRKDVALDDKYLLVMRDAICPDMCQRLISFSREKWPARVFDRSIYVNTDGRHFESPAEVNMFRIAGGDIVGQSICPEVYLAREIGACYAGLYIVVNYAEGIVMPWQHDELAEIFYNEGQILGKIMLEFLRDLPIEQNCSCRDLRKDTLLKKVY